MLYPTDRDLSGPFVPSQQVYILTCKLTQQTRKWFDSFRHHSRICIMDRYRLKCYVTHSYCECIYSTFTNFIFVSSISRHRPAQSIHHTKNWEFSKGGDNILIKHESREKGRRELSGVDLKNFNPDLITWFQAQRPLKSQRNSYTNFGSTRKKLLVSKARPNLFAVHIRKCWGKCERIP
jgi:hypothetical protein